MVTLSKNLDVAGPNVVAQQASLVGENVGKTGGKFRHATQKNMMCTNQDMRCIVTTSQVPPLQTKFA